MKNISLAIILVSALSATALAQGTVNFENNIQSPSFGINTNGLPAGAMAPGTYTVALYWDSTANAAGARIDPASALLTLESTYVSSPATWPIPGQFNGPLVIINGLPAGSIGFFEVAAWTGNFGSYSAAVAGNALVAITPLFANGTGGVGGPPASPALNLTGWDGNLIFTPEPSTIALGAVGAASLLLFRRRK